MKTIKRTAILALCVITAFTFTACGGGGGGTTPSGSNTPVSYEVSGWSRTDGVVDSTQRSDGRYVDGYQLAFMKDTVSSVWFDMTVNSVIFTDSYKGCTASAGDTLAVVDVTLKNTTDIAIEMYYNDFMIFYNLGNESESEYGTELAAFVDGADVGSAFTLSGSKTAQYVFSLPKDAAEDYAFEYLESYSDGVTGNLFVIIFNKALLGAGESSGGTVLSAYEFCQRYSGTWTDADNAIIVMSAAEGDGYFSYGMWSGEVTGGTVNSVTELSDRVYELNVTFESSASGAKQNKTFKIDTSAADSQALKCDLFADSYISYYYEPDKQLTDGSLSHADKLCACSWYMDPDNSKLTFSSDGSGSVDSGNALGIPGGSFTYTLDTYSGNITIKPKSGGSNEYGFSYVFVGSGLILYSYYDNVGMCFPASDVLEGQLHNTEEFKMLIGEWYCAEEELYFKFYEDGTYDRKVGDNAMNHGSWNAADGVIFKTNDGDWYMSFMTTDSAADTWALNVEGYKAVFVRADSD